jgi:Sec-independent protein translocase protein TatA
MEFLGIGLPELGLILVVALLVLGPKDMVSTSRRIARTIRALSQSEFWRTTREAWKMAKDIPTELLRESGLDEARSELDKLGSDLNQWKREVDLTVQPGNNRILPPVQLPDAQLADEKHAQQDLAEAPAVQADTVEASISETDPRGDDPAEFIRANE